jgi:hypothetical protein
VRVRLSWPSSPAPAPQRSPERAIWNSPIKVNKKYKRHYRQSRYVRRAPFPKSRDAGLSSFAIAPNLVQIYVQ